MVHTPMAKQYFWDFATIVWFDEIKIFPSRNMPKKYMINIKSSQLTEFHSVLLQIFERCEI